MKKYLQSLNIDFNNLLGLGGKPFIPSTVFTYLIERDYTAIKRYLNKWGITVSFNTDKKLRKRDVVISGEYDCEKDKVVIFITTNRGMCYVNYNLYKRVKTVSEIIITIMHELIHRKQFEYRGTLNDKHYLFQRTGDPKMDEEYEYLSDTDEVPAFAHCVYTELKMQCPDQPIRKILHTKRVKSGVLEMYKSMYKSNSDTMVELYRALMRWERLYNEYHSRIKKPC